MWVLGGILLARSTHSPEDRWDLGLDSSKSVARGELSLPLKAWLLQGAVYLDL